MEFSVTLSAVVLSLAVPFLLFLAYEMLFRKRWDPQGKVCATSASRLGPPVKFVSPISIVWSPADLLEQASLSRQLSPRAVRMSPSSHGIRSDSSWRWRSSRSVLFCPHLSPSVVHEIPLLTDPWLTARRKFARTRLKSSTATPLRLTRRRAPPRR